MNTRALVTTWAVLLALLGLEVMVGVLPVARWLRLGLLLLALPMLSVVAWRFMEIRQAPPLARLIVMAALSWLLILLALGSLDPFTRIDYPVETDSPQR